MVINKERELSRYQKHGIYRLGLPDLELGLDERTVISLESFEDVAYVWRNKIGHWSHQTPSCIVIASSETRNVVPWRRLKVGEDVTGLEIRLEKVKTGSQPGSFIARYRLELV